jgi:hypothetical protein
LTATVTLTGICNAGLLLLSVTTAALRAALLRPTVQVLVALLLKLDGEQDKDEICAGALAASVAACEAPFKEAVRIPVRSELIVATVAVNATLF